MSAHITVPEPPLSVGERAGRLRALLADDPAADGLISELMPPDVVRVGARSVLDFSDWSQWSQWPQSS